jgi:putative ATP-dependent endonuclease of the OLD family
MRSSSIHFKGHRCFKEHFVGFEEIKPINVIIGRNNTGKSHMLELISTLCKEEVHKRNWNFKCKGVLEEGDLKWVFPKGSSEGELPGDWWEKHGSLLIGAPVEWELVEEGSVININLSVEPNHPYHAQDLYKAGREGRIRELLARRCSHPLGGRTFRHLLADRDVRPELANADLALEADGVGATNIIRKYITTSNERFPRSLIYNELLDALNLIFHGDGRFDEIQVKVHDEPDLTNNKDFWEIFLGEKNKGLVALSRSGSGLKTVLLVLLNLFVVPAFMGKPKANMIFAFEELENNLHPALLRRLFQFLEDYSVRENAPIFITTHSSVALDFFGLSDHAQIIHVKHDGDSASAVTVRAHFDKCGVISELGAKPSDLLQANGIVWVEGPSDRVYINKWIELISDGEIKEGKDYQCAFYGGSLLARTEFSSPEEEERELNRVNLLRINPNVAVVCDGDRSGPGVRIKERVRRIKAEVNKIPGSHIWVTQGREIENYVPGDTIAKAQGVGNIPDPGQYDHFFPRKRISSPSFIESNLNIKSLDKTQFAIECAEVMDMVSMSKRFDWLVAVSAMVARIREWNS